MFLCFCGLTKRGEKTKQEIRAVNNASLLILSKEFFPCLQITKKAYLALSFFRSQLESIHFFVTTYTFCCSLREKTRNHLRETATNSAKIHSFNSFIHQYHIQQDAMGAYT